MSGLFTVREDGTILKPTQDTNFELHRLARARVIMAETAVASSMGMPLSTSGDVGMGLHADALDHLGKRHGEKGLLQFYRSTQEHLLRQGGTAAARWAEESVRRGNLHADAIDHINGAKVTLRGDAVDMANSPNGLPGNLTMWMAKVVEEPMPVLNVGKVARMTNTIHPGAKRYQVVYVASTGEAKAWAGGDSSYEVSEGMATYDLEQSYLLSEKYITVIDEAQYDFLGFQARARASKSLERSHLIAHNRLFWQGNGLLKLWGLKNYPKLTTYETGLSLASCTGPQLLAALISVLRTPVTDSAQVYTPNVLGVATRVMTKMKELVVGASGTSAVSVYAYIRENYPDVSIEEYNELDSFMASGVHGIFAFPRNSDASPNFEAAPPYAVPLVNDGIGVRMYYLSRVGGVFMPATVGARMALIAT